MFQLTAITAQGEWRQFQLLHDDLEAFYRLLCRASERGDRLVSATLKDKNGFRDLPSDALQDPSFLNPIEQLRHQWESILAQPVRHCLSRSEFTQRSLKSQHERMVSIRYTLLITQDLLKSSKYLLQDGPYKTRLLNRYQHILNVYNRMLMRLEMIMRSSSSN